MDINYLTILTQYPSVTNESTGYTKTLKSISMDEIVSLEASYNNGNAFPVALRELLYLAGDYCYVLDYGIYNSQDHGQQAARDMLNKNNRQISRPFFAIDFYGGDQFLFVYLDEGVDDPAYYQAMPYADDDEPWLDGPGDTLSVMIKGTMARFLNGNNPF